MKKILIFGSSGYIGAYLTKYFHGRKNCLVFPVIREMSLNKTLNIDFFHNSIIGDIHNHDFISETIARISPDIIIYCISLNHIDSQRDLNYSLLNNVSPLARTLNEAVKLNKKIKFLYFSTLQIFGNYKSNPEINENSTVSPLNHYALTHKLCDDLLDYFNTTTEIKTTSLILSNSFGYPLLKETDCWWLVMNDFCRSAILQSKIVIRSDGTPERDFISLNEVCLKVNEVINKNFPSKLIISSGTTYNIYNLAKIVKERVFSLFGNQIDILDAEDNPFVFEDNKSTGKLVRIKSIHSNLFDYNHDSSMTQSIDELLISINANKKDHI
jgi:UDP-glucose 4-epimerase